MIFNLLEKYIQTTLIWLFTDNGNHSPVSIIVLLNQLLKLL